ncbi:MAG: ATP-dependent 6-phosphofructokinase, partial [Deltaproteobacteria bacterium]|nr:ATP-dependent 6-phosphofructokinase [Deltaproteobacteria bacterium]
MMTDKFAIGTLGPATVQSPINLGTEPGDVLADFTPDDARAIADPSMDSVRAHLASGKEPPSLELAGPRQRIFFRPEGLAVGIVTCGGLCPGLNNVIRGLVMTLYHGYGVRAIHGFRYGYAGLNPKNGHPIVALEPDAVKDIHRAGGTLLGTSRGPEKSEVMADTLERLGIGLLFAVGGDGTFRGLMALAEEVGRRQVSIGLIGVPKTIDNDIPLVDQTFGFETAVGLAADAIRAAYFEASSVENGIGLVKLMGREAGFIAASAALAVGNANLVLIPEVPFDLEGEHGLFRYLEGRFAKRKPTVIVAAEGAGQEHMKAAAGADASGNRKFGDIGVFLKEIIERRFGGRERFTLKYIDPSYMI